MALFSEGSSACMGRPGRKRRGFQRERNGRAQRKSKDELLDERVRIARSQPHRQGLKSNEKTSELAESALGRLNLKHFVTTGQRAAGETFAGIVARYRGVIEGPRAVRSLMPETASDHAAQSEDLAVARFVCPSQYADPIEYSVRIGPTTLTMREWPCQQAGAVCACAERRDRYMRIYDAISAVGRRALMAVIRVAVRGEEIPAEELVYLRAGLDAAKRELGLTELDR